MEDHADDKRAALKHLDDALRVLDRTDHAQVAAITSHALEMLRGCGLAVPVSPPVVSAAVRS